MLCIEILGLHPVLLLFQGLPCLQAWMEIMQDKIELVDRDGHARIGAQERIHGHRVIATLSDTVLAKFLMDTIQTRRVVVRHDTGDGACIRNRFRSKGVLDAAHDVLNDGRFDLAQTGIFGKNLVCVVCAFICGGPRSSYLVGGVYLHCYRIRQAHGHHRGVEGRGGGGMQIKCSQEGRVLHRLVAVEYMGRVVGFLIVAFYVPGFLVCVISPLLQPPLVRSRGACVGRYGVQTGEVGGCVVDRGLGRLSGAEGMQEKRQQ